MKHLKILALTLWFPFSAPAFQGTEVLLTTPWPAVTKSLQSLANSQNFFQGKPENVVMNYGELQLNLDGVSWQGQASADVSSPGPRKILIASKNLNLFLQIPNVRVDQIVERVVSGVRLRVRIQARCGPIKLTQTSAHLEALVAAQFQGPAVTTNLEKFDLSWAPETWKISDFTCEGVQDAAEVLRSGLRASLSSAAELKPHLAQAFAVKIQENVTTTLQALKIPKIVPLPSGLLPVKVTFVEFQESDEQLISKLRLSWGRGNVRPLESDRDPVATSISLVFPRDGFTDFVTAQLAAQPSWRRIRWPQDQLLETANANWFTLLFVWPDLLNYSKESPFQISLARPRLTRWSWLENGTAQLSLQTSAWLQSFREQRWWNYVNVIGKVQAVISPGISEGKLNFNLKPSLQSLEARMGDEYVNHFNAFTTLPQEFGNRFLQDALNSQSWQLRIPDFDLGGLGRARATSWQPRGSLISLKLKVSGR